MSGDVRRPYKPFYKNQQDMLAEVGITPRQLNHWRKHGLFTPELDEPRNVYTEVDIDELKLLKRLIVDHGFKVEVVRRFFENSGDSRWSATFGGKHYLDLDDGKLVSMGSAKREAVRHLIGDQRTQSGFLSELILDLVLLRFAQLKRMYSSQPDVYKASRDDLLRRITQQDLIARAEAGSVADDIGSYEEFAVFQPALHDDPEHAPSQIEHLMNSARSRLAPFMNVIPGTGKT